MGTEPDLGQAVMGYPARWEHPWMWWDCGAKASV